MDDMANVGNVIGVRLNSSDEVMRKWISNQKAPSKSIKKILYDYINQHGYAEVLPVSNDNLPTQDEIMGPFLNYIAQHANREVHISELYDEIQKVFNLSDEAVSRVSTNTGESIFLNRVRWVREIIKKNKYAEFPRRGFLQITQAGIEADKIKKFKDEAISHHVQELVKKELNI